MIYIWEKDRSNMYCYIYIGLTLREFARKTNERFMCTTSAKLTVSAWDVKWLSIRNGSAQQSIQDYSTWMEMS